MAAWMARQCAVATEPYRLSGIFNFCDAEYPAASDNLSDRIAQRISQSLADHGLQGLRLSFHRTALN